jgi:hypothetical protein
MKVAIERMRSRVEEVGRGLLIVIPSRGSWFAVLFLSAWLCGWAMGELFAAKALFVGTASAKAPPPRLFLAFWLTLWTAGGASALYTWVWNVAGREILLLDGATLSISREPIPIPARRDFDWNAVRNLRVSVVPRSRRDLSAMFGAGVIAFDYGARTFRVGSGLDEAEATMLIDRIRERFQVSA